MQFFIMRKHAAFMDNTGHEVELKDREHGGELLRILLLARADLHDKVSKRGDSGLLLDKQTLARLMPARKASRSTKVGEPITVNAVNGQKSNLVALIGERWIVTDGDSYRLDVAATEIDAFAFERKIEELAVLDVGRMSDIWDGLPQVTATLEELRALRSMWQQNPAKDFSNAGHETLSLHYTRFEAAYEALRFATIYALLQSGTHGDLAEAISVLKSFSESAEQDTDDEVWALLLRAQGSMPNFEQGVRETLERIERYLGEVPDGHSALAEAVLERDVGLLFGVTEKEAGERPVVARGVVADSPDLGALEQIAYEVGISADGSSLRLQGSRTDPMDCIEATNRRLFFSGVFATKWVDSSFKRSRLSMLLSRLDNEMRPGRDPDEHAADSGVSEGGAPARFLILDPESESYERYRRLTGSNESPESVPWLKELAEEHPSFEVRLFDALPTFRIVILDDDVVSISPYKLRDYDHAGGLAGWDAAHVALSPFAPWALARSFEALFVEQWRVARPIEELK